MVSRTSRKKSKGKERKAKKEAIRVEVERGKARNMWLGWACGDDERITGMPTTIQCKHGCIIPNDLDRLVSSFLDDIAVRWIRDRTSVRHLVEQLFQTHPQVWNDENYKQIALNILTRMGTNMLLSEDAHVVGTIIPWASCIAKVVAILEHHDGAGSLEVTLQSQNIQTKLRDLDTSVNDTRSRKRRDVLKFYSKRVSCSCLKEMYREARRTEQKTGQCAGCKKEKERVDLSVCSRCMIARYCSRQCQVAHWPSHEKYCDMYVKTQKQLTADENDKETTE